ncbi:MAG: hypothetical protein ABJG33_12565 [Balneola sp.]
MIKRSVLFFVFAFISASISAQDLYSVINDNEWFLRMKSSKPMFGESNNIIYEEKDSPYSISFYEKAFVKHDDNAIILDYKIKSDTLFMSKGYLNNTYQLEALSNNVIEMSTAVLTEDGYTFIDLTLAKKGTSLVQIRDAILESLEKTKVPVIKNN